MRAKMDVLGTFTAPGAGTCNVYRWELVERHGKSFMRVWLDSRLRFEHRCKVHMMLGGVCYTGDLVGSDWYMGVEGSYALVENYQQTSNTPTLDEPTAPADVDWSEIRSATEARDWRRAWQAVGTDHAGDATPGETYLLSKAAHAKATAAALVAWRNALLEPRLAPQRRAFDPLNADHVERQPQFEQRHRKAMTSEAHALDAHGESWQRIKRIAGWTSQAAAQYASPKQAAARHAWNMISTPHDDSLAALHALWRDEFADPNVRPTNMWIDEATLDALRQHAGIIDDPVDPELHGNGRGVVGVLNNPFLSAAANRGEITGTVTIPPSTSRSIAAMLATQARLTGGARLNIGTEDESITITPSSDMIRWQRPDPTATSHVGIATHATNPNPRGPQPRRRSRT